MHKLNILIVDDSKTFNAMLYSMLKDYGYNIFQAYSLAEAQELLNIQNIDYIILDLNLPDGNGEELIDSIKVNPRLKIIVMTGSDDSQQRIRIFEKGVIDYFLKTSPIPMIVNATNHLIKTLENNKNINILTIDDSSFIRTVLKNILNLKEYTVLEASSAKDARAILKENNIHLILLDLIMPEIDGMSFLEELKSNKKYFDIPVIVISGDTSSSNYARVLKQGASDFIRKPFVVEEVLLKCDLHIKSYLNHQQLLENKQELLKQKTMVELQKKEILKQNIYHRNLIEANLEPLLALNYEGIITDVNNATTKLLEKEKKDIINLPFCSFFTDIEQAKKICISTKNAEKLKNYPLDISVDGITTLNVLCNVSQYFDENNKDAGVLVSIRDVTELNKLKDEAQESSKLKTMSTLLQNIAHHWRQPLSVISTSASGLQLAMEYNTFKEDEANKTLENIINHTKYLSDTIDDFKLLFNKDSKIETCKIQDIIDEALVSHNSYLQENNIKFIKNIEELDVQTYKNELIQIVSNIVHNVKEHTTNNDLLKIDVLKNQEQNNFTIKVFDNGGGASVKTLENIFEPYFTTQHQSIGKGMGMYIVYQIVTSQLKGKISIENKAQTIDNIDYKGLEVSIELPIK